MGASDNACDNPDPGTKEDPARHDGDDAHVHQRAFYRHPGPGAEQGKHRKDKRDGQQLFWRMGRFMQQFAEQADADKEKETDQH